MKNILSQKIILFYLFTIIFSWTIFLIIDGWLIPKYSNTNIEKLITLYGHLIAMLGPMLASIFMLKYFHKKRLLNWKWNSKKYYLYSFYIVLLIWLIPALVWLVFDETLILKSAFQSYDIIFIISYLSFGWIAGVGEEYGWSSYILTNLSEKIGRSKAIIVSGTLRGLWHLPLFIIPVLLKVISGDKGIMELFLLTIVFAIQLIISNIFFSALFGFVWYKTESIPLLGWMHFLFDVLRDFTIFFIIGFSSSIWFQFGWGIPFYFLAYLAFTRIAKEDGYSNYLEIFYKKVTLTKCGG